jgi:prolipoprotein diacylglyceryltransferase
LRVNRLVGWADRTAREGALFAGALCWYLVGRLFVGFFWRDEQIVGTLNVEQALALISLMVIALAYGIVRVAVGRRSRRG